MSMIVVDGRPMPADGTIALPPVASPNLVPQQVTKTQAVLALHATPGSNGGTLLDDVVAAVAAATDQRFKLAWDSTATLSRHGLFVTQLAPVLGLTDAALDALFTAAAAISV